MEVKEVRGVPCLRCSKNFSSNDMKVLDLFGWDYYGEDGTMGRIRHVQLTVCTPCHADTKEVRLTIQLTKPGREMVMHTDKSIAEQQQKEALSKASEDVATSTCEKVLED